MEERDIEKYDYLSVTLKKTSERELLRCYDAMGWEMVSVKEDKIYVDITHYDMRRPQQIEHKDKLLLLQVRVESEVNKLAKFAHDKHKRSLFFGFALGLLSLGCIAAAIILMLYFKTLLFYIVGGALIALGIALSIADVFISRRLIEWEDGVFASNTRKCLARLEEVFSRIEKIRGDVNGRE